MPEKKPLGLLIIGTLKLISACLLIAVGVGIFHLLGPDMGETLDRFVRHLHLDPENKHITKALAAATGLSHRQLKAIDAVTFLYALLYIVEGTGLLMGKHWAEYLTIVATASLIPLELYELAHKVSTPRATILTLNIIVMFYLVYRLLADRKARQPH